jgi:DNA-directed RNA polymerase specialized sigma24 family protein
MESWISPAAATKERTLRGKEAEDALSHLSDEHRNVVDHVLVQAKSFEEVADLAGCASDLIKSRVFRGREKLALALCDKSMTR